ncbi:MAG: 3-oxoacyl-[acyl-carrier-protein] synthase 3 [Herpetosiphonaceae bacterium]|nr:MAG: 3-oxoacyl-[acyl-carrier-protein] synthase 3 [Herpetosiphonaceae bacterium]
MRYAAITGWGMYVPQQILTNADLERMVDTSDEWIVTRTGIRERRIGAPHESTSTMGAEAARIAIKRAGISPLDIDLIIVATASPDKPIPSTACFLQSLLSASRAGAVDINAACSGFIYGLGMASSLIRCGAFNTVLLVGAEMLSRYVNWKDRNTCVLFGDAAGAVVLQPADSQTGVLTFDLGAIPETHDLLKVDAGGSRCPASHETVERGEHYIRMEGKEVFKHAVRAMGDSSLKVLHEAGLTSDQIKLLIPHQANLRIIEATAKRVEMSMDRVFVNIDKYGNTSAATIPVALCEAYDQGLFSDGDYLLLTAFGGGLTWGSAVIRWGTS